MKKKEELYVTKSSLPPMEEFLPYLEKLWETRLLTNMGEFHEQFKKELSAFLSVENTELFVNGHVALELLIESLGKKGEIITTPFSFASTTHAIVRNGCTPVFCDIEEDFYTIDVKKLRSLISKDTVAILPVHVYGHICDVEELDRISKEYGIPVLYDAAHAFGERYHGRGVGSFGYASMFSFHATKVFHSIEGGAVCIGEKNPELMHKLYALKNFGIMGQESVELVGCNGKMNEFSAAMGLCNLRHIGEYIKEREKRYRHYESLLKDVPGLIFPKEQEGVEKNYAYLPVRILGEGRRNQIFSLLEKEGIHPRKYFYPLISEYDCYKGKFSGDGTPIAKRIAEEILTLPIYPDLDFSDIERISVILQKECS